MAASLLKLRGLADELARVPTVVDPDDENMEVQVCKHGDRASSSRQIQAGEVFCTHLRV